MTSTKDSRNPVGHKIVSGKKEYHAKQLSLFQFMKRAI